MRLGSGGDGGSRAESGRTPQLVPMRVGSATVFVKQVGGSAEIQTDDAIYPVSPPRAWLRPSTTRVLRDLGRDEEAIEAYGAALEVSPDYAEALCNKGIAFLLQERR
jgi:hypothetical protein